MTLYLKLHAVYKSSLGFIAYLQNQPELSDWGLSMSRFFPGQFHTPVHAYIHLDPQEYFYNFQSSLRLPSYPDLPFRFLARLLFAPN